MSIQPTTREDDERLLWMIRERCRGQTSVQIAKRLGVRSGHVRQATSKVMNDDAAAEGCDVSAAYWDTTSRSWRRAA